MTTKAKRMYQCTSCGHKQEVTELHTDAGVYVGSAANWCDKCERGKPEPIDPESNEARLERHRKHHATWPNGRPESNVERQLAEAVAKLQAIEMEVCQALGYVDRIADKRVTLRSKWHPQRGSRRRYTLADARSDAKTAAAGLRRVWEVLDPRQPSEQALMDALPPGENSC